MSIWKVRFREFGSEHVEAESIEAASSKALSVVSLELELEVEVREEPAVREELLEARATLEVVGVELVAPRVIR